MRIKRSQKARICPHYQGVCCLDDDIVCYCSSHYEMCDKYKEAGNVERRQNQADGR